MTPRRVQGTAPPPLLTQLNAKGAPTPLPVEINLRIMHEKTI